ncbi:MAG TPA: hypothetical protein VE646_13335 [Actinomycetota bacterium]|jgi:uncharacterized membrane protein YeaQ/YmgE (transglycosylase-associated protein family)|nr:hypothetical protein [Actinomycetota bacterium]
METCWNCGAKLSPDVEWCGQCYTVIRLQGPLGRERDPSRRLVRLPDTQAKATVARSTATSVGIVGKLIYTALIVGAGVGIYLGLDTWVISAGRAAFGLLVAVVGAYTVLGLVLLRYTWRPSRRLVHVGGEVLSVGRGTGQRGITTRR